MHLKIDGLVQERRKSSANALDLHLSCTKPVKCYLENGYQYWRYFYTVQ